MGLFAFLRGGIVSGTLKAAPHADAVFFEMLYCLALHFCEARGVISSVAIRNFRALRNARLELRPFNLIIGPNGSGKTSLIDGLMRLRALARLPLRGNAEEEHEAPGGPEVTFHFTPPHDALEVVMSGAPATPCDSLHVLPLASGEGADDWAGLRAQLARMRSYVFDHRALASRSPSRDGGELMANGANLAAVLATMQMHSPETFGELRAELCRILPEYDDVRWDLGRDGTASVGLHLAETGELIPADQLSQGTLYLLAILALAFEPEPPSLVCVEEIDRGFHPRLLREVRDVLYRLSHPESRGLGRAPVQVIATSHSPYLLDLFKEHPEEVVVSEKDGAFARFWRLSERGDLDELLEEGSLGDMWFAGILGGVPQERESGPPGAAEQ
jgi:predicted ATPase